MVWNGLTLRRRKALTRVETELIAGLEIATDIYTVAKSTNLSGFATKNSASYSQNREDLPCTVFRLNLPSSIDSDTRPDKPEAARVF